MSDSTTQSDWEIVERGWKAHVLGEAEHIFKDPLEAIKTLKVHMAFSYVVNVSVRDVWVRRLSRRL